MSIENKIYAGVGLVIGIIGTVITLGLAPSPNVHEAWVFQRGEGKPAVMRTYKIGSDGILVQDKENKGKYIPLYQHLNKIPDKSDRQIEEVTIKKLIEWYK